MIKQVKEISFVGMVLMLSMIICGCSDTKKEQVLSVQECYQNLTTSDKLFYDDLLLNVVDTFDNPEKVRVGSIRIDEDYDSLVWVSVNEGEGSEERFYGYILNEGKGIFAPVSFEKDPTAWDFAEESKYDVTGINATLDARERELKAKK